VKTADKSMLVTLTVLHFRQLLHANLQLRQVQPIIVT